MKNLLSVFVLIIGFSLCNAQTGETPIELKVLKAVVKINTAPDINGISHSGTGFIVAQKVTDQIDSGYIHYLVTNKHMIGDWNYSDKNFSYHYGYLELLFRNFDLDSNYILNSQRIELVHTNGKIINDRVVIHPDSTVDIAMVVINEILVNDNSIDYVNMDVSFLMPFKNIITYGFNIGDQVFVLGYPLGIISRTKRV